jgi:hypothetical protein
VEVVACVQISEAGPSDCSINHEEDAVASAAGWNLGPLLATERISELLVKLGSLHAYFSFIYIYIYIYIYICVCVCVCVYAVCMYVNIYIPIIILASQYAYLFFIYVL